VWSRSKEEKIVQIALSILSIILGLSGFILIGLVDWRLSVGIFFLLWGWNLDKRAGHD